MQSAAKVGLLLVVFIVLLVGGFAVLGRNLFAPKADTYYADLADAGGVSDGTRILMAGVDIGTVKKVTLKGPKLAQMELSIRHGTAIPAGSMVLLPTSLIGLGDSPVTIVPPESSRGGILAPGTTLGGSKAGPLDSFLPEGRETVKELNKTMVAFRHLLEDQKLQSKVSDLLITSNKTLEHFGALAESTNRLIASNQENIAKALAAGTAAVQDVHRITMRVADLVQSGKLQKDGVAIMERVKKISEHADRLVEDMNALVNDPKLRGPINQSVSNVADITKTGKDIAGSAAEITKNGITISENAAIVSKKAITLTDKATEIATKASDIEDQLKGVLDKVGGFFSKAPSGKDLPKITSEMDLMRQTSPGYWRTDLGFSFPLNDYALHLGIYDAFESDRLTVQLGKSVSNSFGYRYGIYASKPAVGVDYRLAPRLSLRGDAWNINDPRLDMRASYDFGSGLIGWLGVDQILKQNAITFGLGIRR